MVGSEGGSVVVKSGVTVLPSMVLTGMTTMVPPSNEEVGTTIVITVHFSARVAKYIYN